MAPNDTPGATAAPTGSPTPEVLVPLGSDWVAENVSHAPPGAIVTYVHYPRAAIQYDEVVVDDVLTDVRYVCFDGTRSLLSWFKPIDDATSVEVRYASAPMEFVQQGCHLAFVIENAAGDTIGIRLKAHCPLCLH